MHFKDLFVHRLKCIFYPNVFYLCVLYHIRITHVFIGSFIFLNHIFRKKLFFSDLIKKIQVIDLNEKHIFMVQSVLFRL